MTTAQSNTIFFIINTLRASCFMDPSAEVVVIHGDKSAEVSFHQGGAAAKLTVGPRGGIYDSNGLMDKRAAAKLVRNTIDPKWA